MNSDFWVFHEKEGYIHVLAKDPKDAIEQYYDSIKSMIGHRLRICSCFETEPLESEREKEFRDAVLKPKWVQDKQGKTWKIEEIEQ
jgi:hypothetical protein